MASFNNQNSGLQFMTAMASNFNVAGDLPIEDVHNPSNDAVQNDFNADTSATLHPVCPDPDVGYQPLSDYLVAKLLRRTMQYFKNFCAARQVELDTKYWKRYTRRILETQSPDKALVISSPAGSGKSTWMQSFLLALRDVMKEQPEFDLSLVGVVVVLQKVEDLNELADLLNQDCAEDHPVMVSLQGWTDSGSRRGLCRNPSVDNYEACLRQQCPYAGKCPNAFAEFVGETVGCQALRAVRVDLLQQGLGRGADLWLLPQQGREKKKHPPAGLICLSAVIREKVPDVCFIVEL